MEKLKTNIFQIIWKLEMIFPLSFFNSKKHLPMHLSFEVKVKGFIQYRWIYPFKRLSITHSSSLYFYCLFLKKKYNIYLILCRYLFNLRKKVKNKMHVETLICKDYIVEEISIFIPYYFKPNLRTRINRILRHDDDGKMSLTKNL